MPSTHATRGLNYAQIYCNCISDFTGRAPWQLFSSTAVLFNRIYEITHIWKDELQLVIQGDKLIDQNPNKVITQPASDNKAMAFLLFKQINHLFFLLFCMQVSKHMKSLYWLHLLQRRTIKQQTVSSMLRNDTVQSMFDQDCLKRYLVLTSQ